MKNAKRYKKEKRYEKGKRKERVTSSQQLKIILITHISKYNIISLHPLGKKT